jgi:hypothetical protein
MSQIIAPNVSVDTTNGHWKYSNNAQMSGYLLLGFSYQYILAISELSLLSPSGNAPTNASGSSGFSLKVNACIPDDVELLIGGSHFARYRVSGSISGSWTTTIGDNSYTFSYGKLLKTPVLVPANNNIELDSKINDFWTNLYANTLGYVPLCALVPNTARLVIA